MKKAVVIFSGGQDSTTCLHWAKRQFDEIHAITFYYGQKHFVEIQCAREICRQENVKQLIVPLEFLNSIVDSAMVNGGNTSEQRPDGLPTSFVPNRNQLFITLAHAYAQKLEAKYLVGGMCQTDFSGYPDCRDKYIQAIQDVSNLGSNANIAILTPLMFLTKAQTFKMAYDLNCLKQVIEMSHTCYENDRIHLHEWGFGCGTCPACKLRAKGWDEFQEILMVDKLV